MSQNPEWIDILVNALKDSEKDKKKVKPKQQIILTPKEDGLLWFEMLKSLDELKNKDKIIPFPQVFEKICRKFSISKAKAWNCLFFLTEFDLIEIVRGHGIRLKIKLAIYPSPIYIL